MFDAVTKSATKGDDISVLLLLFGQLREETLRAKRPDIHDPRMRIFAHHLTPRTFKKKGAVNTKASLEGELGLKTQEHQKHHCISEHRSFRTAMVYCTNALYEQAHQLPDGKVPC